MSIIQDLHQDEIIDELQAQAYAARLKWKSLIGESPDVWIAHAVCLAWEEAVEIAEGMGPRTEREVRA